MTPRLLLVVIVLLIIAMSGWLAFLTRQAERIVLPIIFVRSIEVQTFPEPPENAGGAYYGNGYLWCLHEQDCLHEIGHFIDDELGYPSKSAEYRTALDNFAVNADTCATAFECLLATFPGLYANPPYANPPNPYWGGYSEFYAESYAHYRLGMIELPAEILEVMGIH